MMTTIMMTTMFFLLIILINPTRTLSSYNQTSQGGESGATAPCPTWFYRNFEGHCECGARLSRNSILCKSKNRVEVSNWLCMGYVNTSKVTVAGHCPYAGGANSKNNLFLIEVPRDPKELNNFTCGWLNRRGLLCSHCSDESLGVAVLSYHHECTKCLGSFHGWLLYLTLTLAPITVFFLIVIFCNIRGTAAHMNGLIYSTQIILSLVNYQPSLINISPKYSFVLKFGLYWALGTWISSATLLLHSASTNTTQHYR